jgi:hypothetical protein
MSAGEKSVAHEKPAGTIAALAYEYRTRLAETCSDPMNSDALSISAGVAYLNFVVGDDEVFCAWAAKHRLEFVLCIPIVGKDFPAAQIANADIR